MTSSMVNLNTRNPTIKRIMKEMKEMQQLGSWQLTAAPLEDNIYEWHFTIRGPADSAFDGGVYHGSILLPQDYPFKPPNIVLLTPNGRFEVGKKICLTISAHHPETWQPSWSVRTALVALIGFFPTEGQGAIGALDYPDHERIKLARASTTWSCDKCGSHNATALPQRPVDDADAAATDVVKQSGIDVSEIKISKIVNIDEPDPASLTPTAPVQSESAANVPAPAAAATAPTPANAVAQQAQVAPQQHRQHSAGGISATQLFVYLLITCILALLARKLFMSQAVPRAPMV